MDFLATRLSVNACPGVKEIVGCGICCVGQKTQWLWLFQSVIANVC